jgi:DNA-binding response OmpR family regulator
MGSPVDVTLIGKKLLAVDDEPDVLETIEEVLDECEVYTAGTFSAGMRLLSDNSYDIVILDIMGVNGLDLLEKSVERGFPTIILTAPAMTPDYLVEALRKGAASYLPKEDLGRLEARVQEVLEALKTGERPWQETVNRLGPLLEKKYGLAWKERLSKLLHDEKE